MLFRSLYPSSHPSLEFNQRFGPLAYVPLHLAFLSTWVNLVKNAMFSAFLPVSTSYRLIWVCHHSITMIFTILKLTLIVLTILPFQFTFANHLVMIPFTLVLFFIVPVIDSYSVYLIETELSSIETAISKEHLTLSMFFA